MGEGKKRSKSAAQKRNERFSSRAGAIKMLNAGADPTETFVNDKGTTLRRYLDHPNSHVKVHAWKKMGKPEPKPEDRVEFFASLHIKDPAIKPEPVAVVEPTAESEGGLTDIVRSSEEPVEVVQQ